MKFITLAALVLAVLALVAAVRAPAPRTVAPDRAASVEAAPPSDAALLASLAVELAGTPSTRLIAPGAEQVLEVAPAGGRYVAIAGEGTSDLDAWLVDAAGRCVARDEDATDVCLLQLHGQRGPFQLHVHNVGADYDGYRVATR